jgi:pyridoxine/pyridoxamine 5'-phosphate oxidase
VWIDRLSKELFILLFKIIYKICFNFQMRKVHTIHSNKICNHEQPLQVRIEGRVCQLSSQIADEYWQMRPIASRIGSKLSEQSAQIPGREYLMQKQRALEELCEREGQEAITRPDDW